MGLLICIVVVVASPEGWKKLGGGSGGSGINGVCIGLPFVREGKKKSLGRRRRQARRFWGQLYELESGGNHGGAWDSIEPQSPRERRYKEAWRGISINSEKG